MLKSYYEYIRKLRRSVKRTVYNLTQNRTTPFKIEEFRHKPLYDFRLLLHDLKQRGLKVNYFLDVGAHNGDWSRMAIKKFPGSTAYLIEPLSEMEDYLKQFCKKYQGSKFFLCAAGAEETKKYLTVGDILEGSNLLQEKNDNLVKSNIQRYIDIRTIDSFVDKNEICIPELVKLDVQGYEIEALKGASRLFGKTEVFILEVSLFEYIKGMPIFSDVINFMSNKGYEVFDFPGFSRRPFDNALGQIDVCFVKKDSKLRSSNAWFKLS